MDLTVHFVPQDVRRPDLHRSRFALDHAAPIGALAEDPPEYAGTLDRRARPIDDDVEPAVVDGDVGREPEWGRTQHAGVHHQHDERRHLDRLAVSVDTALEERRFREPPGPSDQVSGATKPVFERPW